MKYTLMTKFKTSSMLIPTGAVLYVPGTKIIDRYVKTGVCDTTHGIQEIFWVQVKNFDIRTGLYKTIVSNDLARTDLHGLKEGDVLYISKENICLVMD